MKIEVIKSPMKKGADWHEILKGSFEWLAEYPEIGWTSALKQCASDAGIPYGDEMQAFMEWADRETDQEQSNL